MLFRVENELSSDPLVVSGLEPHLGLELEPDLPLRRSDSPRDAGLVFPSCVEQWAAFRPDLSPKVSDRQWFELGEFGADLLDRDESVARDDYRNDEEPPAYDMSIRCSEQIALVLFLVAFDFFADYQLDPLHIVGLLPVDVTEDLVDSGGDDHRDVVLGGELFHLGLDLGDRLTDRGEIHL